MDELAKPRMSFWKSLSALDWVALVACVFGLWALWLGVSPESVPGIGLVKLLGLVAAV